MEKLEKELIEYLNANPKYPSCRKILKDFKDIGGEQKEALELLERLRYSKDEAFEDKVLEVMDIVASWCYPPNRIWDNQL